MAGVGALLLAIIDCVLILAGLLRRSRYPDLVQQTDRKSVV